MAEKEIHALVEDLRHGVHKLVDPRLRIRQYREIGTGDLRREVHQLPSIVTEMVESLGGLEEGVVGQGDARSVPPLWMDGLRWLREIEYETRSWLRHARVVVHPRASLDIVLHRLAEATWRPQDHRKVLNYSGQLWGWVREGEQLLAGRSQFGLRDTACPNCGVKQVRRQDSEGRWGSVDAMQVSMDGARCLACRQRWDSSVFRHLGQQLGCKTPEELSLTT
ncbi:hypothetical protein K8O93_00935 [Gordonia bronchialis]|uniref:DUF7341 domain-containing protein n=1 Tax=Gordonia bronchialis TaxID=2054 RepID=UPI001CBBBD96|nr:hypothetical protein [Gordonia bronchialis]UAK38398.1 hypothetical protein K8O93_00935 [Gordonia bronchialis]